MKFISKPGLVIITILIVLIINSLAPLSVEAKPIYSPDPVSILQISQVFSDNLRPGETGKDRYIDLYITSKAHPWDGTNWGNWDIHVVEDYHSFYIWYDRNISQEGIQGLRVLLKLFFPQSYETVLQNSINASKDINQNLFNVKYDRRFVTLSLNYITIGKLDCPANQVIRPEFQKIFQNIPYTELTGCRHIRYWGKNEKLYPNSDALISVLQEDEGIAIRFCGWQDKDNWLKLRQCLGYFVGNKGSQAIINSLKSFKGNELYWGQRKLKIGNKTVKVQSCATFYEIYLAGFEAK